MANEKILQMPSGFPIQPTDAVPIARTGIPNGSNFSVAASQLVAIAPGPHNIQIGGNTSGTTANISSGTLFLAGGPNITLSQIGNAVTISGGAGGGGGGSFSAGLSNIGNTSGTTGVTGTQIVLAGGNNVTLSQSNDTAGATITVSAGAGFSAGISGGNSAGGGTSGLTGTQLLLAGGANVTLSQVNGLNGATISISASQPAVNLTIGGNTTSAGGGAPLISSGTMFLAGGANITLSQNGQSVTISAGTAAAASLSISAGTTSSGYGGITFADGSGVSWGLNNGTITASVSQSVQTQAAGNIAGTNTAITGLASITLNTIRDVVQWCSARRHESLPDDDSGEFAHSDTEFVRPDSGHAGMAHNPVGANAERGGRHAGRQYFRCVGPGLERHAISGGRQQRHA